jgi:IS5 family transposase
VEGRIDPEGFLSRVDRLVDWSPIERMLKKHYKKTTAADGRPVYPGLTMFKILLVQRWYGLSDAGMSEALQDRLSFLRFSGLSFHSPTPDASTICRFRQALLEKGFYRRLLSAINEQLSGYGMMIKEGVAVDASLIASSRRPRKVIEVVPAREGDESQQSAPKAEVKYSDDTEASWTVRGKQPHYGYKVHMGAEIGSGFILGGHTTGAHEPDSTELEPTVEELDLPEGALVLGDKGYAGERNRAYLKAKGFHDGIMEKAYRDRPLCKEARTRNLLIRKLRYIVEQGFGTLKRHYGFARARYLGRLKTEMEFHLLAIAFNLKKAVGLMVT